MTTPSGAPALSPTERPIEISVVIPIYNEQENLPELYRRLSVTLGALARPYEIVFVNDYSRDRSLELITSYAEQDSHVKCVSFSRNFGHQTALTAGMQFSQGEFVILMDGDLQDPPEILPQLLDKAQGEDWDVVYAVRKQRKENAFYRFLYMAFYRILQRLSYIKMPLDSGDFCLMRRRVVDQVNSFPERNRFLRGLRAWVGFRQTGMEYERHARFAGEAKYTLTSLLKLALDGIISFSFLPLRIATWFGFATSAFGILYALGIAFQRFFLHRFGQIEGWTTVVVAVLVLGGMQMMLIGIIGEYVGRIFEETKRRPQYIVERAINFSSPTPAQPGVRD